MASKNRLTFLDITKKLVWVVLVLTIISTIFLVISPMLPTSEEYTGSFPERFWENFHKWTTKLLPRRLIMLNEYYDMGWILNIVSMIFFLLLLLNIRNAIDKYDPEKPGELIDHYFNWAISSVFIAIVFITKSINEFNIALISFGILGLVASIFILLYYVSKVKR